MATTNSDSPDSPSPPAVDGESKMESEKSDYMYPTCGPQNDCSNSDGTTSYSGDAESVDHQSGVSSDAKTSKCTRKRNAHCNGTKIVIAAMIIILIMLAAIIAGLGVYVGQLHTELRHMSDRIDRIETRYTTTFPVNKTEFNSEVESGDLSAQIFNLSIEIDSVKASMFILTDMIHTMQATHERDVVQIRMNVSTMLAQINTSLTSSLLLFADKAASNISELNKDFQRELSSVRNHSLMLAQNLTDQVMHLKRRSYELGMNASALESSINEQVTRLTVNVSSNEQLLRAVSTTQEGHTTMIEQMRQNFSLLDDQFDQQLSDTREHLIATLSDFNTSLSLIDTSHRDRLRILSSHLNNLDDELVTARKEFRTNTSLLREELVDLSEALDNTNDNLTDLSSAQKRLLQDLAKVKEVHSGSISAIGQSLIRLNEELDETNEHLDNVSSIQDGLRRDLVLTNEALRSNISALEETLNRELNRTEMRLQNQDTELWLSLGSIRGRLKANISALQESHGLLQGDVGRMKDNLQTLSSQHINLQSDYNITKLTFYTTKAATEQNMTQLHVLIQNHSRLLGEAEQSRSMLSDRINQNSNSVTSHDALISGIRSSMTMVQNSVADLHSETGSLNIRIIGIQNSMTGQSRKLTNLEGRMLVVEQSDAVRVVPLGSLPLSAIACILLYSVMF